MSAAERRSFRGRIFRSIFKILMMVLIRFLIIVTYVGVFIAAQTNLDQAPQGVYNYKEMEILDDLPMKLNLEQYLDAMEKLVFFVNGNKHLADLSLCFGIYLINVNLRKTLQAKGRNLPYAKVTRLDRIVQSNDEIMKYFAEMTKRVKPKKTEAYQQGIGLYSLYTNDTTWTNDLHYFNIDLVRKTRFFSRKNLEGYYFKWSVYMKNVNESNINSVPTPAHLDNCLYSLAQNPISAVAGISHCLVPFFCASYVFKGLHYGFGILYRLKFLLAAEFSRRCVLSSTAEDKILFDKLCARVYNEAEFIAFHDFGLPDLIMEQIAACSLGGHAQFVRRSWIEELLDFQNRAGCFHIVRPDGHSGNRKFNEKGTWQFLRLDPLIHRGQCHSRASGYGGAVLASAIRFIIDTYY